MSASDYESNEYSNNEESNTSSNSDSNSASTYNSNEESDGDNGGANNGNFVAKGGFGCVVKPALRNIDSGALKSFPGQISKVFKSETSYDEAIEASQKAYNIMGKNKGHKVTGYKRAFTGSNLKKATRKGCRILGRKTIYPVRMDDLGKDISKIDSYYNTLRTVPFVTILEEIVKVFHQVKLAYDAGYIHGDIRETNIMVNPDTGRLTLIDFDWFLPKAKFLNDYKESLGFYSNPPEALLYWYIRQPLITKTLLAQKCSDYVKYTNGVRVTPITERKLEEANLVNYHHVFTPAVKALSPTRQWEALQALLFKTFDSYGLAFTIQRLVRYVYPGKLAGRITNHGVPYSAAELAIIEDIVLNVNGLLDRMTQLNVAGRIVIKDAYRMIKELLEEYKSKVLVATAPKTPPTRGKPTTPLSPKAPPSSPVSNRKTRRRARH